jgi:hypothetical protein
MRSQNAYKSPILTCKYVKMGVYTEGYENSRTLDYQRDSQAFVVKKEAKY